MTHDLVDHYVDSKDNAITFNTVTMSREIQCESVI